MKKHIYIGALIALFLSLGSCNRLDDIEPTFRLQQDQAIIDVESARAVLSGIYVQLRDFSIAYAVNQGHTKMGLTYGVPFWAAPDDLDLNVPNTDNTIVEGMYEGWYTVIQESNLFLQYMEQIEAGAFGGEDVKNSLIAEGRFMRALGHFYLLRAFGQFYDTSSPYGIALRLEAATNGDPLPRNTVAECYNAIYEDLDYAIANCTATARTTANILAAISLKAKVKLYEGDYSTARDLAQQAIESPGDRFFEAVYADNFSPVTSDVVKPGHEASGLIFGPYVDSQINFSSINDMGFFGSIYEGLSFGDPRGFTSKGWFIWDFTNFEANSPTQIYLRLAEVYLIHAEAAARANGGVDADALVSLNAVRTRAAVGLAAATPVDNADLLEAIRIEKLLELYTEGGEEFFDLIRYHIAGNLDAATVKPTMNNMDYFIWPIPDSELLNLGASDIVEQNPGY